MKKTTILLFTLLLTCSIHAQEKKAVDNKLKTITVTEQKWEKGTAGKVMTESITRFDQKGNILEEIEYKQGKVDKHFTYKYDANNNKVQEIEMDPSGKKIRITTYTYQNNLRTERTVVDGNNQPVSRKTYKYETY
jgi:hypothetical protein